MVTPTDSLEKRLAQLKKEVPTRGLERHPSLLKSVSDLPAELQSPALGSLAPDQAIKTIIAFPPQIQRGWHYVPKQALLFTTTGLIHLTASIWPDQEPQVARVNASGLLYLKVTLLLLYGFLEIVARGEDAPAQLGVEFNTVAWELLSRPIRQMLTRKAAGADSRAAIRPTVQSALEGLPLKFSNGVRIFVSLPGEELEELLFQPGLWGRRRFWPMFFRKPITADTLVSLTTSFLVVIQEELGVGQGWIVSYIPRANIIGIESRPHGTWNELAVRLMREDQAAEVRLRLRSDAAGTWHEQWTRNGGRWQDLPDETGVCSPGDGRPET